MGTKKTIKKTLKKKETKKISKNEKVKKETKTDNEKILKSKDKNIKETASFNSAIEDKYLKVSLDTFLYNAGIIGFIKVLETAEAKKGDSIDNKKDYFFEWQDLYVSKEFLLKKDLAQTYINAMISEFGERTSVFDTLQNIEYLIDNKEIEEKLFLEKLKSIVTSLSAASINTGCETLKSKNINISIQENIEKIKKSKNDLKEIKKYLKDILIDFKNKEIKQTLLMKNIIYTKIRLFWENKAFLLRASSKKDIKEEFLNSFEKPLKLMTEDTKTYKYKCISCDRETSNSIDTTFLFEVGVDTGRKKSAFWNQTPDSFICPLCNFIYSCSPLGFIDIKGTMIFVNQNESIESLISMNVSIDFNNEKENKDFKFYNTIIERALSEKTKELNSLQVVIRNEKRYSLNIIGKDILEIINIRKKELGYISRISIKISKDDYINVFNECLLNIFNNINQWNLIFKILKYDKNISSCSFILSILIIQITQKHIFHKEENVDNNIRIAYAACKSGNEMRKVIIGAKPEKSLSDNENKEADNKLRGLVYQLVNSVHTSNRDLFLGNITRLYTAMNITIPTIFINAFKNDEDFKEVGYAYILGLKGAYYSKEENQENKTNKE